MFDLADSVKQTRVYQEGVEDGERKLIFRLLTRRVGTLSASVKSQIEALSVEQLEALGDALLEFTSESDLVTWLEQ